MLNNLDHLGIEGRGSWMGSNDGFFSKGRSKTTDGEKCPEGPENRQGGWTPSVKYGILLAGVTAVACC